MPLLVTAHEDKYYKIFDIETGGSQTAFNFLLLNV